MGSGSPMAFNNEKVLAAAFSGHLQFMKLREVPLTALFVSVLAANFLVPAPGRGHGNMTPGDHRGRTFYTRLGFKCII